MKRRSCLRGFGRNRPTSRCSSTRSRTRSLPVRPGGVGCGAGTSVVQHATEATGPSTLVRLLVWAPLGALLLHHPGRRVLLAAARRDPRVRLRDEIADAVGSPVLAAVRSRPQRSVAGWSTLLETYEATPVESWAFRQLLRGLVPTDTQGESRPAGRLQPSRFAHCRVALRRRAGPCDWSAARRVRLLR